MAHSHNHEHPDLKAYPKMSPLLVWSKDKDLLIQAIDFIKIEFEEHVHVFSVNEISSVIEKVPPEEIEFEIEKYDFHVIKIYEQHIELIMIDNQRHIAELKDDIEIVLDKLIRNFAFL